MTAVLVRFTDVGRNAMSWTAEIETINDVPRASELARSVKKHRALTSKLVGIEFETSTNGCVCAGDRTVGRWAIVQGSGT